LSRRHLRTVLIDSLRHVSRRRMACDHASGGSNGINDTNCNRRAGAPSVPGGVVHAEAQARGRLPQCVSDHER
jgi:hypothetical protein